MECWGERKLTDNCWIVNVGDVKDYDISAKNPNSVEVIDHKSPIELVENIKDNSKEIIDLMDEVEAILIGKEIDE